MAMNQRKRGLSRGKSHSWVFPHRLHVVLVRVVLGEESALPARNVSVPHPEGWALLLRQVGGG